MQYATIGTVSAGTLRNEDLIPRFADELRYLASKSSLPKHPRIDNILHDADNCGDFDSDDADDILQELMEWLQTYAPDFVYFGAHIGDGADFGFWPDWDALEDATRDGDVVRIEAGDEPTAGKHNLAVNDRGNATLYGPNGRVLWDCV